MLPQINHIDKKTAITDVFYGYNHRLKIGDGESYDEENLGTDSFPVMSNVKDNGAPIINFNPDYYNVRDVYALGDKIGVLIDEYREIPRYQTLFIYEVDGTLVTTYDVTYYLPVASAWNVLMMGAYIVFFPKDLGEGFYINTTNGAIKRIGRSETTMTSVEVIAATVDYDICDVVANMPPSPSYDGDLFIQSTSGKMYRYSAASDQWSLVPETYAALSFYISRDKEISAGDAIRISGLTGGFEWLNGDFTVLKATKQNAPDSYFQTIVINTPSQKIGTPTGDATVSSPVPEMDFVFSHENRLWGCKYDGVVNSIYASALGDPGKWFSYQGISTDSYEVTVGDMGKWTGAVSYNGNPVFFKKDRIYTIYGSYPAEYTLQATVADGVDEGSIGSIAQVGGYLYYNSPSGFMRYNSYPQYIGGAFEGQNINVTNGIGTKHKYYAVTDDEIYCYDTLKDIWHKESHEGINGAVEVGQDIFLWYEYYLYIFHGGDYADWYYISGDLAIHNPTTVSHYTSGVKANNRHQYVTKITVRAQLGAEAQMHLWLSYDGGEWEKQADIEAESMQVYDIPIRPRRHHSLRLKMNGSGECKVYAITKDIEEGTVIC